MTWSLLWAILTNPWRFLKALFPGANRRVVLRERPAADVTLDQSLNRDFDAIITRATTEIRDARPSIEAASAYLDLSFACTEPDDLGPRADNTVRAGRLPQACLGALRLRARRRVGAIGLALAVLVLEIASRALAYFDPSSENDGGPVGAGGYLLAWSFTVGVPIVTACIAATFFVLWARIQWDLRSQSLRSEEGWLVRKWTKEYDASEDGRSKGGVRYLARIDNKNHEIASVRLFDRLAVGERYRMFLSRRAGILIAIESVELIDGAAGYRTGAGHRPLRAGSPVRPGN